ncbi:MAG TPA: dienelactone hydrolase family protein [Synechococcales cyanobacterium M55_K2018_004]|nr:dienelactone hydrolase family protein [Synechococcales cyanobacterium M55_K2018_004]
MGTKIQGQGYLAVPTAGSGPGVLVLQEWWGLVPHICSVADRFAAAGYVALAPDLYEGKTTTSPDEAGRLLMALNIEKTAQKLEASANYLLSLPEVIGDRVGVVGFCMGGQLALLAGTMSDRIGAVVDFYGIHPNVKPNFTKLSAPVLGIFGEADKSVPVSAVHALESAIQAAGGNITTRIYPGAGHAFFNDTRPEVYNPDAAADAWQQTLSFLQKHLAVV